jgi:hypothetical protein
MKTNLIVVSLASMLPMAASLGQTADAGWKTKPIAEWTPEDAREVLTYSPWSHAIRATLLPEQNEAERRAAGQMGRGAGLGFDGLEGADQKKLVNLPKTLYSDLNTGGAVPPPILGIRWESATPVRAAELKTGIGGPPTLSEDGYLIAVYGVPGVDAQGSPEKLGAPLKRLALLRRQGKPDLKPIRVEVFQLGDGAVIAYLFPKSAGIATQDGSVEFVAEIGRLYAAYSFRLEAMQYQGKLEIF